MALRTIAYVSRNLTGESLRCARALRALEGVRLLGLAQELPRTENGTEVFEDIIIVDNANDSAQLIEVAGTLSAKHGSLAQLVTAQETLLEAVARANEALGLEGMSVATVRRALDKPSLKRALSEAGIATALDSLLTSVDDGRRFAAVEGFPLVLKPVGGSGGLATLCVRDGEKLEVALNLMQPSPETPVLAETYLRGRELCFDTITIANEPRFYSICLYRPTIMEALENSSVQWTCFMPLEIETEYRDFIESGLRATRALAVGNAMTHLEGFILDEGEIRFTDATLRPAGARLAPMLGFAYDMDQYRAWARAAVDSCFDGPWQRKYSVGTIFLRGTGSGVIENVDGLKTVKRELGEMIVDARVPRIGGTKASTYTGDGYVTVRSAHTGEVEDALELVAKTVKINYSSTETACTFAVEQWSHRLQYADRQLYKPAWEDDSLSPL
jgi:hypothetical protein